MARKHALWSASSAARNLHCAGAITLGKHVDPAPESQAAAWGTGMHSIIEWSLRTGGEPAEKIGTIVKTDEHAVVVDEEMAEAARVSVTYCRSLITQGTRYWIEDEVSLAPIGTALESGGTVDFAVWDPARAFLDIVDHKGGRGHLVEVPGNPQTRSYALGWLCKHRELYVERVRLTIVQPRIPHPEGVVRSELLHIMELIDWAHDLKAGIARAHEAMRAWDQVGIGDEAASDVWATTYLRTGHCTFCPAAGQCPALRREAQALVNRYFESAVDTGLEENMPDAVERDLERIELVEQWIRERRAYAHRLAEGGTEFKNFMLVDRHGNRRWNESDEAAMAARVAQVVDVDEEILFNRKLKSPAQVEKLVGKRRQRAIADLWHVPITGRDLVRRQALGAREPTTPIVQLYFEKE